MRARRIASSIALGIVLLGAIVLAMFAMSESYAPTRSFVIARGSGWLAALLLTGALVVSPVRWLRRAAHRPELAWLVALRRSLGLTAAACALAHAAYGLTVLPGLYESLLSVGWLRAGLAANLLLCALFVTSFDTILRRLRLQHWKLLHWLVYPAALCGSLHALLSPFGIPALELTLSGTIIALLLARLFRAFYMSRERSGLELNPSKRQSDGGSS